MPLQKGIYRDPATRARWIIERRATLYQFERLTAKGLTQRQAAARLGVTRTGIKAMRASVEGLEGAGGRRATGATKSARVDLGLALLSVLRRPAEALTAADIAAWCDCSPQTISRIEKRALAKVRRRLTEIEVEAVFAQNAAEVFCLPPAVPPAAKAA